MADETIVGMRVGDVRAGKSDFAGDNILCVYTYNPPHYVVYRTLSRVMVHFADDPITALDQRRRIACLTPLRGQINGLIDGWHGAGDIIKRVLREAEAEEARYRGGAQSDGSGGTPAKDDDEIARKRALRYDRRVADAITLGLENDVPTAMTLLAEIKNDIINERIAFARNRYLIVALAIAAAVTLATILLWWLSTKVEEGELAAISTAVSGGTLGALFSVAIGLKGRTVLIDLQNRVNVADACLRMLIGAMSGGMLLCLLLSGLVGDVVNVDQLSTEGKNGPGGYNPLLVFVVGFLGGFFERLVPDLLSQTNFATTEARGAGAGTAASHAAAAGTDNGGGGGSGGGGSGGGGSGGGGSGGGPGGGAPGGGGPGGGGSGSGGGKQGHVRKADAKEGSDGQPQEGVVDAARQGDKGAGAPLAGDPSVG